MAEVKGNARTPVEAELISITECCICKEIFCDPRVLPCLHTFCLRCLEATGSASARLPGDAIPCPVCRTEFVVPAQGFTGVQKNFFMDRLIAVLSPNAKSSRPLCDVCLEDCDDSSGTTTSQVPLAEMCCTDCSQKLCAECFKHHKKHKLLKTHRIVKLDSRDDICREDLSGTQSSNSGDTCRHTKGQNNTYCNDCKMVVCKNCCADSHFSHRESDLKMAEDEFCRQIEDILMKLTGFIGDCESRKASLVEAKGELLQKVESVEKQISVRGSELREAVNNAVKELLTELNSVKRKNMKDIETEGESLDIYRVILESCLRSCGDIKTRGFHDDDGIFRAYKELNQNVDGVQLMHKDVVQRQLPSFYISFRQTNLIQAHNVGRIHQDESSANRQAQETLDGNFSSASSNFIQLQPDEDRNNRTCNQQTQTTIDDNKITDVLAKKLNETEQELKNQRMKNEELRTTVKALELKHEIEKKSFKSFKESAENLERELRGENRNREMLNAHILDELKEEQKKERGGWKAAEKQLIERISSTNKQMILLKQELEDYKAVAKPAELEEHSMTWAKMKEQPFFVRLANAGQLVFAPPSNSGRSTATYSPSPELVQAIRVVNTGKEDKTIYGITVLENELFLVMGKSPKVSVYALSTFVPRRSMWIEGLVDPVDIGSCVRNKCLYIIDCTRTGQDKEIVRINAYGNLTKKWVTGEDYGRLSIAVGRESTVILSVAVKNKLNEYTSDGVLVRQINFAADTGIVSPLHAIKLNNGNFVVSHGFHGPVHRVCLVKTDGKSVLNSFDGKEISPSCLDVAIDLAVDGNGSVFVSDPTNSQIILLGSTLGYSRTLLTGKNGLQHPWRMCLDESNGRLLVAELLEGLINVFNIR